MFVKWLKKTQHRLATVSQVWIHLCVFPFLYPALVVIRPNCTSNEETVVSSSILALNSGKTVNSTQSESSNNDSITLPSSVYGHGSDCTAAGLVVVVYDGIGPLLSSDQLLPNNSNCSNLMPRLAHGQWWDTIFSHYSLPLAPSPSTSPHAN